MNLARRVVWGTVLVVVVTSVLSGPLVGAVDLTSEPTEYSAESLGNGTATVDVDRVPTTDVRLERTNYETYALKVPDAQVSVSNVTGQPMLVYRIKIPELGVQRSSIYFLDADAGGELSISMDVATYDEDRIASEEYDAELQVLLRGDGGEELLHRSNVTAEVRE